MPTANEDPDYLAPAQLAIDPYSFSQVVLEAYRLEHGCILRLDVAEVLGLDKSRISQIFGKSSKLKVETIQAVLKPIKSKELRRRILVAWNRECFGMDFDNRVADLKLGARVNVRTLQRVDRFFREMRYSEAAWTAHQAAQKAEGALREQLLDRAYFAYQRLDYPGRAMRIVRLICEGAKERSEPRRLAMGHFFRLGILLRLADCRLEEIEPIYAQATHLVSLPAATQASDLPYVTASISQVQSYQRAIQLTAWDRGWQEPDERALRAMLEKGLADIKRAKAYQDKFNRHLFAASVYLLLGEAFQAQEHVDLAFKSGSMKNLGALDQCGLLTARIMALTEPAEDVANYLIHLSATSGLAQERYFMRKAEYELARIESGLMERTTL